MINRPTCLQSLREDFEDFKVGFEEECQNFRDDFKDFKIGFQDECRDSYASVKEQAQQELPKLKKESAAVRECLQKTFHPTDTIQSFRNFRLRMGRRQEYEPIVTPYPDGELNFHEQIRKYESDLRSTFYASEINKMLEECLPSSKQLSEYYESRPELELFTIEKELHRITYTFFTHEGKKMTKPEKIKEYYCTNKKADDEKDHKKILWRSANQSLLGDLLGSLTSRTGLVRPHLKAATSVSDISILVDFACDKPFVQAECFLNLSIPNLEGEPLSLAGVLVAVYFCPDEEKFKARISHVFPSKALSEEEVNTAARALSNL